MEVRNPVVIHWVHEMEGALAFYKGLFGIDSTSESPSWSVLDLGPLKLALHRVGPGQDEQPLRDAGLNLEVDDLDDAVEAVEALGGAVRGVRATAPPLALRVALCADVDGNAFELREQV